MNKAEAIDAMCRGEKVTHRHFSNDEWMTIDSSGDKMLLEDGVKCSINEFWKWRTDESWDDGYSLWEK